MPVERMEGLGTKDVHKIVKKMDPLNMKKEAIPAEFNAYGDYMTIADKTIDDDYTNEENFDYETVHGARTMLSVQCRESMLALGISDNNLGILAPKIRWIIKSHANPDVSTIGWKLFVPLEMLK